MNIDEWLGDGLSTDQVNIIKNNSELTKKVEKIVSKYLFELDTEYKRNIIIIEIKKLITPFIRDKKIDIICL